MYEKTNVENIYALGDVNGKVYKTLLYFFI